MNSNKIGKRVIVGSTLVRNGRMTYDLANIREDLDVINELFNTSFTEQTKDRDIVEHLRKLYNQSARKDYSYNNQKAKDAFNSKYALYAHVRDRRSFS